MVSHARPLGWDGAACLRCQGRDAIGSVRTFDCGVILVDEVALDELDREARLADTSSSDNNELVFPEELMRGRQLATGQGEV